MLYAGEDLNYYSHEEAEKLREMIISITLGIQKLIKYLDSQRSTVSSR